MSRVIKFRAWSNFDGKYQMIQWDELLWLEALPNILHGDAIATLMQFTGLCDKNGIEIYESDLISWDGQLEPVEVVWNNKKQGWMPYINATTKVEGNIYEHPEPLGAKDE